MAKGFRKLLVPAIILMIGCAGSRHAARLETIVKQHEKVFFIEQCIDFKKERKEKQKRFETEKKEFDFSLEGIGNINVDFYTSSKESASNIIVLPTLGEPASSIEKFCMQFSEYGYNVFALDVPGFGKSSGNRGEINLVNATQSLEMLIDKISEQYEGNIVMVGSSMGGEYIIQYMLNNSDNLKNKSKVKSIAVQSIFLPFLKNKDYLNEKIKFLQTPFLDMLAELLTLGKIDIIKEIGKNNVYTNPKDFAQIENDPDYVRKIKTKSYIDFVKHKPENNLNVISVPILSIISSKDKAFSFKRSIAVYSELLEQNLQTKLYIIDAGHMAFDEQPDEMSDILDRWFRATLK